MKAKILVMTEKREYVRQVVAYANYFKDFKKTLSRDTLRKIYQIFIYIMTLEQVPEKFLKELLGYMDFLKLELKRAVIFIGFFVVWMRVIW